MTKIYRTYRGTHFKDDSGTEDASEFRLRSEEVPARVLPALPVRIIYRPIPTVPSVEKLGEEMVFRFRIHEGADIKQLDAFSLSEAFLETRTSSEALSFLTVAGQFRDRDSEAEWRSLTWTDFQRWQALVRMLRTGGPLPTEPVKIPPNIISRRYVLPEALQPLVSDLSQEEHSALQMAPSRIRIRVDETTGKDSRPRLIVEITVVSILEAVFAVVFLDRLRGANYRLCALPDCPNDFEVRSKHEREYCSQYCAHKASMRRRRAQVKGSKKTKSRSKRKGN